MSAVYDGLEFETALVARWAAFFDLAGWNWSLNPVPVFDWKPDFRITFKCNHSECNGSHTLLVSILPIDTIEELQGHPALSYGLFVGKDDKAHLADAGALFGTSPNVSQWQMSHGAGGGIYSVVDWVHQSERLWTRALEKVPTK